MRVESLCDPGVNFPFFCIGVWQLRVPPFDDRSVWPEGWGDPFGAVAARFGTAPGPASGGDVCELWYTWLAAACRAAPGPPTVRGTAAENEEWCRAAESVTDRFQAAWPALEAEVSATPAASGLPDVSELLALNEHLTGLRYGDGVVRLHYSFFPAAFGSLNDCQNFVVTLGTLRQPWAYEKTVRHELLHVLFERARVWDTTCLAQREAELRGITQAYPQIGSARGVVEEAAVILLVAGGTRLVDAGFGEFAGWLHHPVLTRIGRALWLERSVLATDGVSAWLDTGLRRCLDAPGIP